MGDRKSFLLRIDSEVLGGLQRWADDELRSLNGQIEYLLRQALLKSGRTPKQADEMKHVEENKVDSGEEPAK